MCSWFDRFERLHKKNQIKLYLIRHAATSRECPHTHTSAGLPGPEIGWNLCSGGLNATGMSSRKSPHLCSRIEQVRKGQRVANRSVHNLLQFAGATGGRNGTSERIGVENGEMKGGLLWHRRGRKLVGSTASLSTPAKLRLPGHLGNCSPSQ